MNVRPPLKKRRTLYDFFSPKDASIQRPPLSPRTMEPKPDASPPTTNHKVPGLCLEEAFISPTEESTLLSFLNTESWRSDLSRPSIHYGGTYCLLPPRTATPEEKRRIEQTIITAPPMPDQLSWLIDRMIKAGLYAHTQKRPEYCIVNSYAGNMGISAHVENFRFDEPVCGLTLGRGDWMRFHELKREDDGSVRSGKASKAKRTGRKVDVWLPRRSLMVMRGESRRKWQHEIVRSRRGREGEDWRRVSLTFRVEKEKR